MQVTNILDMPNDLSKQSLNLEIEQKNFLSTTMGKIINTGLNIGIRSLLPDIVEDEVIEIKDAILKNGFKEGAEQAINSAIDLWKSTKGIATGKFENINQAHEAIKSGGTIDGISSALNFAISKAQEANLITYKSASVLRKGKDVILDSIESNIEDNFNDQLSAFNMLNKYEENWKTYYGEKDFSGMEKEYNKIENTMKKILPIEDTLKEARRIENLHLYIKNNGKRFNLSNEELELAKQLN